MTATINDGFTQTTATGGETTIDFDFLIYGKDDIAFYETDLSGVITLLVRGTDYSIADSELNDQAGGEIVLDVGQYPSGATAGHKFTCISDIGETRSSDFQQGGDFFAQTLNTNLDRLTRVTQQLRRDVDKAARLKVDSLVASVTFTDDPQDGYGIVWDGVLGNFRNTASSIAVLEGNAAIVAANIASVNTVATNIASVNTVAGISANVTTVAGIAANVTTVAGISANVTTVAGIAANVTTVAGISTDVSAVAAISAAVSAVAAIDTAVSAVAAIDSDVTTVAGIASDVATLAPISADISAVAAIDSDVTTVAGIAAAVSTVASIAADVTAAANNIPKANRTATTDPTVNDDSGDGYSEGSLWVNTTTDTVYICADPALGAAVWQALGAALSGLSDANISGLANNDFLVYKTSGSKWQNRSAANARTDLGLGALAISTIIGETQTAVASGDSFLFADASNSDAIRRDTIQGILNLVSTAGVVLNVQGFTSSGTYTRSANVSMAIVILAGATGGGSANSTNNGTAGGTTSFGSHVSCTGGSGGTLKTVDNTFIPAASGSPTGQTGIIGSRAGGAGASGYDGGGQWRHAQPGGHAPVVVKYITSGLGSTETVTIGAAGAGGAAGTEAGQDGLQGYIVVIELR